jgi:hypothetical protein
VTLSAWEQCTLGYIADELADSAPELTSMLTLFNRLTSGEAMPARQRAGETGEAARHRSRTRRRRYSARWQRRRIPRRVWPLTAVALTVTTAIVMTLVLTLAGHRSGGNPGCTHSWPIVCPRR